MAPFENGAMFGSAAHLDDMRSRIGKGGNGIPLDRFAVDDKAHRTALFVAIAYDQAVAPVHAFLRSRFSTNQGEQALFSIPHTCGAIRGYLRNNI